MTEACSHCCSPAEGNFDFCVDLLIAEGRLRPLTHHSSSAGTSEVLLGAFEGVLEGDLPVVAEGRLRLSLPCCRSSSGTLDLRLLGALEVVREADLLVAEGLLRSSLFCCSPTGNLDFCLPVALEADLSDAEDLFTPAVVTCSSVDVLLEDGCEFWDGT